MSGTMDKIKAKVENVLHKDKDTTHSDPTGPHDSHAANKADPRVDSDHVGGIGNHGNAGGLSGGNTHSHGTTGSGLTGSNTYGSDPTGPHDSRLGNKADPRVDSDQVGGYGNTSSAGGYGTTGHSSGLTGNTGHSSGLTGNTGHSSGLTGTGHNTYGSDPTGPHDSHLANKADPRVDSDRVGGYGNSSSAGGYGTTGHSSGLTGSGGHSSGLTGNTYGSDPTGPHDSRLGNKADPRVDSDQVGGYGNTQSTGGYGTSTGSHGTHGAGIGGASDYSSGPGPAPDTAGPHKSNLANKVDPRVDSDLDGSKTYGGNKTSGY
ncbi:hypothetical protein N0V90_012982 [Kalmusia sp. IMI 367209]|nr:hypothetical protein N0V90_012982 [Kalmusia sp. IMI 367209]